MAFKFSLKIDYHLDLSDDEETLSFDEKEMLDKQCKKRVFEMIQEGYTSGELVESLDEATYYGWWYLNTKRE